MAAYSLRALKDAYEMAEAQFDVAGRAACMAEAFRQILDNPVLEQGVDGQFFAKKPKIFLLAALHFLVRDEGEAARYYLDRIDEEVLASPAWFPVYAFYKAWAYALQGDGTRAVTYLCRYLERFPQDAHAASLRRALQARQSCDWLPLAPSDDAIEAYHDIPLFINSRDRLGCLQLLLARLSDMGYRNIMILDNGSTYAPLFTYYKAIEGKGVRVFYLPNLGHRALWESGVLQALDVRGPYLYTDSDVVPGKDCPDDFVRQFLLWLRRYPYLVKVGTALEYRDATFYDAEKIKAIESRLYELPMEPSLFYADVDTTLAVYRGGIAHYTRMPAARAAGIFTARHLPWCYDYEHLPEDEAYYMEHADQSSSVKAFAGRRNDT